MVRDVRGLREGGTEMEEEPSHRSPALPFELQGWGRRAKLLAASQFQTPSRGELVVGEARGVIGRRSGRPHLPPKVRTGDQPPNEFEST